MPEPMTSRSFGGILKTPEESSFAGAPQREWAENEFRPTKIAFDNRPVPRWDYAPSDHEEVVEVWADVASILRL